MIHDLSSGGGDAYAILVEPTLVQIQRQSELGVRIQEAAEGQSILLSLKYANQDVRTNRLSCSAASRSARLAFASDR